VVLKGVLVDNPLRSTLTKKMMGLEAPDERFHNGTSGGRLAILRKPGKASERSDAPTVPTQL
jgi:hypothetical protein